MKIALKDCTCFPLPVHAKGKSARGSAGQKPVPFRRIILRNGSSILKIPVHCLATGQAGRLTAFAALLLCGICIGYDRFEGVWKGRIYPTKGENDN